MAKGGRVRKLMACCGSPGVQATMIPRLGQWLIGKNPVLQIFLLPIYYGLSFMIRLAWGIAIPHGTKIGPGLYIGHYEGIFISSAARIGRRASISQQVIIGLAGRGEDRGSPTIGDNIKIGANAVVYKDIPDNAVVVLDPGFKIVSF